MNNIKYHTINIVAVLMFSLVSSAFVREVINYSLGSGTINNNTGRKLSRSRFQGDRNRTTYQTYESITQTGFFPPDQDIVQTENPGPQEDVPTQSDLSELSLIGTITGPNYIARALIQKRGEKSAKVFALYRINKKINNDVYGYKLVRITPSKVYLKKDKERFELDLYAERKAASPRSRKRRVAASGEPISKSLSRAEIMQKASNMMDLSKGLVISPHRVNGKVEGFRLKRIRPYNVLHKIGFRPGDIIKRINGKKIDTMQKAMGLWSQLKTESSINVDLERGGRDTNMNFSIAD